MGSSPLSRAPRLRALLRDRRGAVGALALVTCSVAALPFLLTARPAVSAPPGVDAGRPAAAGEGVQPAGMRELPAAAGADRPAVAGSPEQAASTAAEGTAPAPGAVTRTPSDDSQVVFLDVDGTRRGYLLLPALGLADDEPAALLVVLHHDVASAREVADNLGLDGLRRQGVTLAYPAGAGGSWNAGECCGTAVRQGIDDVAFVNAVLDDVGNHTPVDPERRALLGYSGGGMLVYRVLCGPHPPLVAAVEINGSLEHPCPDPVTLPHLLSVHGEKDGSIGLSDSVFVTHLGMAPRSVVSTLSEISASSRCTGREGVRVDGMDLVRWSDCNGGSSIEAQIVLGAGHGWADVGGAQRATDYLLPRLARRTAR
jgi:polyhydroxybutyrate depolymerase